MVEGKGVKLGTDSLLESSRTIGGFGCIILGVDEGVGHTPNIWGRKKETLNRNLAAPLGLIGNL